MVGRVKKNGYLWHKRVVAACVFGIVISCVPCFSLAQTSYQNGQKWFRQRAVQADSFRAGTDAINKAIQFFEESLKVNYRPQASAAMLLHAYYFKGMYAGLPDAEQKEVFDKARSLGERVSDRYPESAPIAYWYGLSLRRWDQMHNLWQTTIDRTDKKLRELARRVIELDSTYQGGGGYRLLAKIHRETPAIWLIKDWPSDKEALRLIQKAVKVAPELPQNRLFYALMLLHFGRDSEAKTQLQHIRNEAPRPDFIVEDRYTKYRGEQLWQKHFSGTKE